MKSKLLALALVSAGLAASSAAMAASTTHTLAVSASVTGNCKFNSAGPTALAFGAIDPSSTTDATATATVTFRCTTGTTSSMTSDDGLYESGVGAPRMKDAGTNYLPYSLSLVGAAQVGSGHGAAGDKTLTVNGTVLVADFQNATAGAYSDTVTLTIAP